MKISWKQGTTLVVVLFGLLLASCGYQAASVPQVIRDYELVTGCRLEVLQELSDGDETMLTSYCKNGASVFVRIPDDGDAHDRLLAGKQPMKAPYGDLLFNDTFLCTMQVDLGTVIAWVPSTCDPFNPVFAADTADNASLLRRFAAQMRLVLK